MKRMEWHLYPESLPIKDFDWYLITITRNDNKKLVRTGYSIGGKFYNEGTLIKSVVAWAELPEPYVGGDVQEEEEKDWWTE